MYLATNHHRLAHNVMEKLEFRHAIELHHLRCTIRFDISQVNIGEVADFQFARHEEEKGSSNGSDAQFEGGSNSSGHAIAMDDDLYG